MKILSLRFTNLNSLQGSWEIDFTHASFASEGIFAITGRTGAGKSTILDAICLALFGQTPRLKTISTSTNDIMSRHTGECSAEVDFTTPKGSFRATWYQNRARKKIDGALQPPKHTLAELETGTFLTEKTTETVREIEEITGLNFTRFTRSVLLAQGSFAAFLQARDDERSDVLEQLTGTEVYSDISIAVYNQTKEERLKLERLQESVRALRLLTAEEHEALDAQLGEQEKKRSRLHVEHERLQGVLNWFGALAQLEQDLRIIDEKKIVLAAEREAFMPFQESLALAQKALELDAPYTALKSRRAYGAALEKELAETKTGLEEQEKRLSLLSAQRALAATALSTMRKEHQAAKLVHLKVRELDMTLGQQLKNLQIAGNSLEKHRQEATQTAENALARRTEVLEAYGMGLQLYCQRLVRSSHQILDEGYWPLERLGQNIIELITEHRATKDELQTIASRHKTAEQAFAQARKRVEESQNTLSKEQEHIQALRQEREALLSGHCEQAAQVEVLGQTEQMRQVEKTGQTEEPGQLGKTVGLVRTRYDEAQEVIEKIQQGEGHALQAVEAAREWARCEENLQDNQRIIAKTATDIKEMQAEMAIWQEELADLERANLALSFKEHREHLASGQPCPLCGALEHPYLDAAGPLASGSNRGDERGSESGYELGYGSGYELGRESADALEILNEHLRTGEERIAFWQAQQAEGRGRIASLMEQRAEYKERFAKNITTARECLQGLPWAGPASERLASEHLAAAAVASETLASEIPLTGTPAPESPVPGTVSSGGEPFESASEIIGGAIEKIAEEAVIEMAGESGKDAIAKAIKEAVSLVAALRSLREQWAARRATLRRVLDEAERLSTAIEQKNGALQDRRAQGDILAGVLQEATLSLEGYRQKLIELTQKEKGIRQALQERCAEWQERVRPLGAIPPLPEDIPTSCLATLPAFPTLLTFPTLPPIPESLGAEVKARMAEWLQKHQKHMEEALGTVTPSFALVVGGENGSGENPCAAPNSMKMGQVGDVGEIICDAPETIYDAPEMTCSGIHPSSASSFDNLTTEQIEEHLARLSALRKRWLELESATHQNTQRLQTALPLLQVATEAADKAAGITREQEVAYEALQAERQKTLHERRNLFGEKNLEEVEKAMANAENTAEDALTKTAAEENALQGRVAAIRTHGEELAAKVSASKGELDQGESDFLKLLATHGFSDEGQFASACMDSAKRKQLEEEAQTLANRMVELESQEREKRLLLNEKKQQPPSDESKDVVTELYATIQHDMRQCDEFIGGLREKIEQNALQERQKQGRLAEIAAQQVEFGRWETLNTLIGHSEGKKFRRFAQGLTFEAVVSEANKVLARLSERYTLLRDTDNPLELNVCDSDQAGEIRSTRNLSGGESFIVSLALALGLSSMASRTVRLDSLFLDEGFGALDEDSLDVALDVLASLPDDGKVIGIISHVTSLKERIRKNIQVVPMAGGRSRLEEGEGVRCLKY